MKKYISKIIIIIMLAMICLLSINQTVNAGYSSSTDSYYVSKWVSFKNANSVVTFRDALNQTSKATEKMNINSNKDNVESAFNASFSTLNGKSTGYGTQVDSTGVYGLNSGCWHYSDVFSNGTTDSDGTLGTKSKIYAVINISYSKGVVINDKYTVKDDSHALLKAFYRYYANAKASEITFNDNVNNNGSKPHNYLKLKILSVVGSDTSVFSNSNMTKDKNLRRLYLMIKGGNEWSSARLPDWKDNKIGDEWKKYEFRFLCFGGCYDSMNGNGQPYNIWIARKANVETGKIRLIKRDSVYDSIRLNGAEFVLYSEEQKGYVNKNSVTKNTTSKTYELSNNITYDSKSNKNTFKFTTGEMKIDGYIDIKNVPVGKYKLVETKAPSGYKVETYASVDITVKKYDASKKLNYFYNVLYAKLKGKTKYQANYILTGNSNNKASKTEKIDSSNYKTFLDNMFKNGKEFYSGSKNDLIKIYNIYAKDNFTDKTKPEVQKYIARAWGRAEHKDANWFTMCSDVKNAAILGIYSKTIGFSVGENATNNNNLLGALRIIKGSKVNRNITLPSAKFVLYDNVKKQYVKTKYENGNYSAQWSGTEMLYYSTQAAAVAGGSGYTGCIVTNSRGYANITNLSTKGGRTYKLIEVEAPEGYAKADPVDGISPVSYAHTGECKIEYFRRAIEGIFNVGNYYSLTNAEKVKIAYAITGKTFTASQISSITKRGVVNEVLLHRYTSASGYSILKSYLNKANYSAIDNCYKNIYNRYKGTNITVNDLIIKYLEPRTYGWTTATMTDTPLDNGGVTVIKTDDINEDLTLDGVQFIVQNVSIDSGYDKTKEGNYVTKSGSGTTKATYGTTQAYFKTNKDGKFTIENLLPGKYKLIETSVGGGINPIVYDSGKSWEFTIEAGKHANVNLKIVKNKRKGAVQIKKIDGETKQPVEGIGFMLFIDGKWANLTSRGTYYEYNEKASSINYSSGTMIHTLSDGLTLPIYKIPLTANVVVYELEIPQTLQNVYKLEEIYIPGVTGTRPAKNCGTAEVQEVTDEEIKNGKLSLTVKEVFVVTNNTEDKVIIKKVDKVTGEVIPDVTFHIIDTEGYYGEKGRFLDALGEEIKSSSTPVAHTTNSKGIIDITGIKKGKYTIREVYITGSSANKYKVPEAPDNETQIEVKSGSNQFIIENSDGNTWLKLKKIDSKTKKGINGIMFSLMTEDGYYVYKSGGEYKYDGTGSQISSSFVTTGKINGEDGMVAIDGLEAGNYILREISTTYNTAYKIPTNRDTHVEIKEKEVNEVIIENTSTSAFVRKVDKDTGKGINGITFTVKRKSDGLYVNTNVIGQTIYTSTPKTFASRSMEIDGKYEDGIIYIQGLEAGEYIFEETSVGNTGYKLPDNQADRQTTVTIEEGKINEFTITNTKDEGGHPDVEVEPVTTGELRITGKAWVDKPTFDANKNENIINNIFGSEDTERLKGIKVRLIDSSGNIVSSTSTSESDGTYTIQIDVESIKQSARTIADSAAKADSTVVSIQEEINALDTTASDYQVRYQTLRGQYTTAYYNVYNPRYNLEYKQKVEALLATYHVQFSYDGVTYQNVEKNKGSIDSGTSSVAEEISRDDFNKDFEVITGEGQTIKGEEVIYNTEDSNSIKIENEYLINAITDNTLLKDRFTTLSSRTSGLVTEINNINLGVYERIMPELAVDKDVYNATISINGKNYTYHMDKKHKTDITEETTSGVAFEKDLYLSGSRYLTPIYRADVEETGDNKEQVKVMYKIQLLNNSPKLKARINDIEEYFSDSYNYLAIYEGTVDSIGNKLSGVSVEEKAVPEEGFKHYKIAGINQDIPINGNAYIYIEFEIIRGDSEDNDMLLKALNEGDSGDNGLQNIVEISSYSNYSEDNKVYAGFDSNSIPNNYYNQYDSHNAKEENDSNTAPGLKIVEGTARTIRGKIFEDSADEDKIKNDNERLGNGIYDADTDREISGVKVQLVEINADGTPKENGKVYETKAENGNYKIEKFIPGDYKLVYTWGEESYSVLDGENKKITYSPTKYKSTILNSEYLNKLNSIAKNRDVKWYQKEYQEYQDGTRYSEALDNKDQRLAIEENASNLLYEDMLGDEDVEINDLTKVISSETEKLNIAVDLMAKNYDTDEGGYRTYHYDIENIDFGIIERPKQSMQIVKELSHIKITDKAGVELVDSDIQNGKLVNQDVKYTVYLPKSDSNQYGAVKAELDNAYLPVDVRATYKLTVKNTSEIDYYRDGELSNYYIYGKAEGADKPVKLRPEGVYDYMNSKFDIESMKLEDGTETDNYKILTSEEYTTADGMTVSEEDESAIDATSGTAYLTGNKVSVSKTVVERAYERYKEYIKTHDGTIETYDWETGELGEALEMDDLDVDIDSDGDTSIGTAPEDNEESGTEPETPPIEEYSTVQEYKWDREIQVKEVFEDWVYAEKTEKKETKVRDKKLRNNEIIQIKALYDTPMIAGETKSVTIEALAPIASSAEEITLQNDAEITNVERSSKYGRIPFSTYTTLYDRGEKIIITPPTGDNKDNSSMTVILASTVMAIMILGIGIVFIKKKVLNK